MEQCPACGHYSMYYNFSREEWVCICDTYIPVSCYCHNRIYELKEEYNKRLLKQNRIGRHFVDPPLRKEMKKRCLRKRKNGKL